MIELPPDAPVVIVDDNEAELMILETVFERSALDNPIERCRGGAAILERMDEAAAGEKEFPGLILMDINMPRMSGFDVLKLLRVRGAFRERPVIMMMSSSDAGEDRSNALELGAEGYLVKPTGLAEYVTLIDKTFTNQR